MGSFSPSAVCAPSSGAALLASRRRQRAALIYRLSREAGKAHA